MSLEGSGSGVYGDDDEDDDDDDDEDFEGSGSATDNPIFPPSRPTVSRQGEFGVGSGVRPHHEKPHHNSNKNNNKNKNDKNRMKNEGSNKPSHQTPKSPKCEGKMIGKYCVVQGASSGNGAERGLTASAGMTLMLSVFRAVIAMI